MQLYPHLKKLLKALSMDTKHFTQGIMVNKWFIWLK